MKLPRDIFFPGAIPTQTAAEGIGPVKENRPRPYFLFIYYYFFFFFMQKKKKKKKNLAQ